MLIFLDIDGVLNRHEWNEVAGSNLIERDLVNNLNDILHLTGAKIVISSAWRYIIHRGEANLIGFDWLLRSHGMVGQRLIGITDRDTMETHYDGYSNRVWAIRNERGHQIQTWLNQLDTDESYVVLDDGGYDQGHWTDMGITTNGHPVVWTDPKVGLTSQNATLAIDLLLGNQTTWPDSPMRGTCVKVQG